MTPFQITDKVKGLILEEGERILPFSIDQGERSFYVVENIDGSLCEFPPDKVYLASELTEEQAGLLIVTCNWAVPSIDDTCKDVVTFYIKQALAKEGKTLREGERPDALTEFAKYDDCTDETAEEVRQKLIAWDNAPALENIVIIIE